MIYVSTSVKYVGTDDDNLDLFEAQYPLTKGISYNSYVISDEKTAVVDAVDSRRCREWMANLDYTLRGETPEYLIVHHLEPDHSGSILEFVRRYPEARIVASAKAVAMLGNFFPGENLSAKCMAVKEADTLCLGKTTLSFIMAPMVHWPEVMMTFVEGEGVLFSADAFGTFATPSATEPWDDEARRYYCNIVGKYGANVRAVLKKLAGKDIRVIAPLHGPMLSENLRHYIDLYHKWSGYEPETEGVLVAYASVYGGTAEAARRTAAMLREAGVKEVVTMDLCRHDVSYAVAEAFRLSKMLLCSVTYNAGLFPPMYGFLHHLCDKNLRGRKVGLIENGSWAPLAGKLMHDALARMKDMTVVGDVVTIRSRATAADYEAMRALAAALAAQ